MAVQALTDFVEEALRAGASRAEIERALKEARWPEGQIRDALATFADQAFVVPVPRPRAYISAREAFLYLVLFVLLGTVSGFLGTMLFTLTNWVLPQPGDPSRYAGSVQQSVRFAVSALVVAYPAFFLLTLHLAGERARNPAMQASRLRKWLTYLALVVAVSALISDLIAVLNQFLSGELTVRFAAKAAIVGAIAAATLLHYVPDIERSEPGKWGGRLLQAILGAVATAIVAGSVGYAIASIDSPLTTRKKEMDVVRLSDLRRTADAIDCYYTYFGRVPQSLDELAEALRTRGEKLPQPGACSYRMPSDPVTGKAYVYDPAEGARYSLCATFAHGWSTEEIEGRFRGSYGQVFWPLTSGRSIRPPAAAGEACFELEAVRVARLPEDPGTIR
ncbi:MAG: hypothetical protein H6923_03980 [Alphaproteobacteria bacterium]|nr:hypothetical protein [Alphaproteobacteria bacterium]